MGIALCKGKSSSYEADNGLRKAKSQKRITVTEPKDFLASVSFCLGLLLVGKQLAVYLGVCCFLLPCTRLACESQVWEGRT